MLKQVTEAKPVRNQSASLLKPGSLQQNWIHCLSLTRMAHNQQKSHNYLITVPKSQRNYLALDFLFSFFSLVVVNRHSRNCMN